jgi:uroporphyrinogen decarboxylase
MAEISSKELIRSLFLLQELPRTPFVPWVGTFAARLEQITTEEMLSDPGLLSTSLLNAQQLFGYDAIATVLDSSLEAEACGCQIEWPEDGSLPRTVSHPLEDGATIEGLDILNVEKRGRIPAVLETVKRIGAVRGKQVAIFGMITGPLTLARHLKGNGFVTGLNEESAESTRIVEAAGSVGLRLCRKYCELGVDAIVVAEEMLGSVTPRTLQMVAGPLKSVWNVARFFGVRSLLLTKGYAENAVDPILALQADGIALSGDIDHAQLQAAALKRGAFYGRSVPDTALGQAHEAHGGRLEDWASTGGRGSFLTTDWEVPPDADVNAMHELMRAIRGR